MSTLTRTIGVVTVARSDYGIYLPVLRKLRETPGVTLWLYVSGMHLEPDFGFTVQHIEADGFDIRERVPIDLRCDGPEQIAAAMGRGVSGFSAALARSRPDVLVVLGDRFDMFPAALAALPMHIPVAHIHGGELTEGAIDDALRHAITKLSHIHFVSTTEYGARVKQLGEEPWRVIVSGAPALDHLRHMTLMTLAELENHCGFSFESAPLLVTFHPETLASESSGDQMDELVWALAEARLPVLFTLPNADAGNQIVKSRLDRYVAEHSNSKLVHNLGVRGYLSAMLHAGAMVGNSSSGLVEAPSLKLPVVNIGDRQRGRLRARNVLDVPHERHQILAAIRTAVSAEFRASLHDLINPYGDGFAAPRIVEGLININLNDPELLRKRFISVDMSRYEK